MSVSTWSFSLPVCDAAQSEDDSTLILLHNLQDQTTRLKSQVKFTFKLPIENTQVPCKTLSAFLKFTHLQTKPDGDREE